MIRDTEKFNSFIADVRTWVREVAMPNENLVEENAEIPEDIVADMRERGFYGWSIPEQYGGTGLTTEELAMAAMELSQCSVVFRARVGTNTGIGSEALIADGTEEQKNLYLPKLASGDVTGCFAFTEPEAGSDAIAMRTTAIREGSSYILNGTKCFITNAPIAGFFTVFARTDVNDPTYRGITAFIIERDTPGLSVGKPYKMMGQSGSPVSEVYLNDCRVHRDNIVGGVEGMGFKTGMKALNKQRIHLSALCTGPAIRMLSEAVGHAKERVQFGRPIADFQLVKALIADCQADIHAARALILETARKRDNNENIRMEASICKYVASEMCGRVADRAVQIFGGSGYVADYSRIERWYRDVRLFRLYEGTSQIHQLNIARHTLEEKK